MDIRASLATLSASSGPSGREQQTLERAMELLRPLVDEVSRDRFGNLIGVRRCGKENAKRVVLDAHLDEVGLVITGAKDGFLRFRPVGGIDPRMLPLGGCAPAPCAEGGRCQQERAYVRPVHRCWPDTRGRGNVDRNLCCDPRPFPAFTRRDGQRQGDG